MNIKNAVEKSKGERPNYPAEFTITARDTLKVYKNVLGTENYSESVMKLIEFHDSQTENVLPKWKEFEAVNADYFDAYSNPIWDESPSKNAVFGGFYRNSICKPEGKSIQFKHLDGKIELFLAEDNTPVFTIGTFQYGEAIKFISAFQKSSE